MALSGVVLVYPMIVVTLGNSITGLTFAKDDDLALFGVVYQVSGSTNYKVNNNIIFYTNDTKVVISGGVKYYLVSELNIIATETAL